MGGWIKLEKDLLTDPRLLEMAAKLCNAKPCNAQPLPCVAHASATVLGGLVKLWFLADTHIGQDDVLPLGINQINQFVGVEGFAEICPKDWLQIVDADHVKLPDYHTHNGTTAKQRALNMARVNRHRVRRNARPLQRGNAPPLQRGNGETLLDQDQDQDKKKKLTKKSFDAADVPGLDAKAWADWVEYRAATKRALRPASMATAAKQMAAMGTGQRAAVDFSIGAGYQALVEKKANGQVLAGPVNRDAAQWAEAKHLAQAIGYRAPWPQESAGAYLTAVKLASDHAAPLRETLARIRP